MAQAPAQPLPLLRLRERLRLRQLPSAAKLRAVRRRAGLTQQELANELGITRISVARYESGRRRPRGQLAESYGRLLQQLQESTA